MVGIRLQSDSDSYDDKRIVLYETEVLNKEAQFALEVIERWAMVAAKDAGEDSAGRHCVKLASEQEVVDRAFTVAKLAFMHMRATGMFIQLPDLNDVNAERDAAKAPKKDKAEV